MARLPKLAGLCLIMLAFSAVPMNAQGKKKETVDERIKRLESEKLIVVIVKESTRDACDKSCAVTFTSTTDGDVVVKPGETRYFKIDPKDDYTRSGGYYWKCCGDQERSRMRGAVYVKVVRRDDTGAFDQYRVEIQLKD